MKQDKRRSGFAVMSRLIVLVKPLTGYMVLAIGMGTIGHLCAAFVTIFGGYAVLNVLNLDAPLELGTIFVLMAVFALVRGVLRYGEQACNHFIAFKLLALLRDKVFRALRRLSPAKLDGKDKGDLISLITSDIELLEVFYAHTISPAAIALLFCGIMCLFIGSIHYLLGLIALAAYLVVGVVVPIATSALSKDGGMRFRKGAGELSAFVLESLRGLSETMQYGQGKRRLDAMNEKTEALSKDEKSLKELSGRNSAVTNSVVLFFDILMLFASARLYVGGNIGFEGILIATVAIFSSFGPVISLAALGGSLQNTFAAGNRVLDILDEIPSVGEVSGRQNIGFDGAEAKDVSFSYGNEEVLRDVSVDIPKGSIVGIVGKSGSGKTTLLKLFMRFMDARSGKVSISGKDIAQINTANLRDIESYVTQDTHLFRDSIKNNLRLAKLDASDEEIYNACKKASVHDFIMTLPKGYDTTVGELGDALSGGERQRLGLAQAFLRDSSFMLLDEPTGNLDSLNEAVIIKAINEQRQGRTVMLISHRRSTMRIADKTYSVDKGRVS